MTRIVVLGAGLTGLSASYHLRRLGVETTLFERADWPGGACRTVVRDGFHFDMTGHLLHIARPETHDLLREIGARSALAPHRRRAGIALAGTVTPYPIQINTYGLPREIRRDCVLGFVEARLCSNGQDEAQDNFAAWVLARFGEGFARHFFFPYNRKLYCADPTVLTTEWVGRYVPRPELADVIDGSFGLYSKAVGYNASFLYPRRGGIQLVADTLAARVSGLRLAAEVKAIHLATRTLELTSGESVGWDEMVATVPLAHLAALTSDLPADARGAAAQLRAVAVVNLNLGVRGRARRREHWLYVPEERYPFYRVGFPSNHGRVAPPGFHALSVEVSVPSGAPAATDLSERCLEGLEELGLVRDRADVMVVEEVRLDPAYVLFDVARPAAVATLRDCFWMAGVSLVGRWAEWKYSTMEDALWDGATVARRLTK